ncbi:MAG TPA: ABC transporter substrate-binding protein [Stellaceae bacterium]|nr:ABC transporter substrate-binding protein [Stellaceae bacterium]
MKLAWALALGLAAALAVSHADADAPPDKIVLGLAVSIASAPYYIAEAKGYLAAENITADGSNYRGAQDAVAALATGEMDVAMGAINAGFFNAANQGLDLRAVASLGIQPLPVTATPLIARKDLWDGGAIKSGADLRGRTVAVNTPGASPEYFLSLILEKYGMSLKDANETMIAFPEMVVALRNKAIDAAIPAEPFATLAIREGLAALVTPEGGAGGGDMTTVFFFSGKFQRERPDVSERFLRAMIRGARDAIDYRAKPDIVAIIAAATKIKPEIIVAAYPYGWDPDLDIAKYEDSIRRQERQHLKDGRLTYTQPIAMDRMVAADLVHRAAASLAGTGAAAH